MLTVAVLGRVEVRRDGVPSAVPSGLTTTLLVRLALDAGRPVRVDRLVDDLWPGEHATRRNTLQAKVSQLRRALGDPAALTSGPAGYTLAVPPTAVDALEALRLADSGAAQLAAGDPAAAAASCRSGLVLFGTEILPAAGEAEWARAHRVRLEDTRLRLTEDELAARMQLGASGEVTGVLEALVAAHPLRERLWALLVTALYRAGRQSDALAAHRRVARLLAEELGIDPGPELASLERQVLTHDRALAVRPSDPSISAPDPVPAADGPAVRSVGPPVASDLRSPARLGNLPGLTTPLVGRADDVATLVSALDAHRLVTVTGPAGVGKTRLAVEVARHVDAPHGTWLVRLDAARSAEELAAVVAEAVPFVQAPEVVAGLRGADTVLVVDNAEHLVEAVGVLVAQVLDTAPLVRVLVTSQRPLGLDGELVSPLEPLAEPDAVALFTRQAAARGAAAPTAAEDVARLCRALDRLPLAIELAAARTRVLTVPEILARLDDRFALLADTAAGRPARRRSLATALAWSYDLLSPAERRGLWAIAAFPDGATLAAVEHVLAALTPEEAATALDTVERLVDRSLVTVDRARSGTRYRLLDSVRAFARARAAEAACADVLADAVVGWVEKVAARVAAGVRGADAGGVTGQAAVVAVTAAERATVDAALERARYRDPVAGLRIAVDLGWAWVLLDDVAATDRLRLARTPDAPRGLQVHALLLESWIEAMSGDLVAARRALDAGTVLASGDRIADGDGTVAAASALSDDEVELVDLARWYSGFVLIQEGRFAEALGALDRCRVTAASRGDAWTESASTLLAAFAHLGLGDTAAGRTACEEAIRTLTPLGDSWALLHAEAALGRVAQAEGRSGDAARHHAHAADTADALGFRGAAALHRAHLGRAQHAAGDPAAAASLQRAADEAGSAGDLRLLASTRVALAQVLLADGDRDGARGLLEAADRWYAASGAGDDAALSTALLAALDGSRPQR